MRDLNRAGFSVLRVEHISSGRGRNTDIHLFNDVVISWDVPSLTLWAEGPPEKCERVERYLRARYERRGLRRRIVTGWYVATSFFRRPFGKLQESVCPETLAAVQGDSAD